MKDQFINCPNCNSPQKFSAKEKVEDSLIIKYVNCLTCREQFIIDTYPVDQKKVRQQARILKLRRKRRDMRLKNG